MYDIFAIFVFTYNPINTKKGLPKQIVNFQGARKLISVSMIDIDIDIRA